MKMLDLLQFNFNCSPCPLCSCVNEALALSRRDGSVEIWNVAHAPLMQFIIPASIDVSSVLHSCTVRIASVFLIRIRIYVGYQIKDKDDLQTNFVDHLDSLIVRPGFTCGVLKLFKNLIRF